MQKAALKVFSWNYQKAFFAKENVNLYSILLFYLGKDKSTMVKMIETGYDPHTNELIFAQGWNA